MGWPHFPQLGGKSFLTAQLHVHHTPSPYPFGTGQPQAAAPYCPRGPTACPTVSPQQQTGSQQRLGKPSPLLPTQEGSTEADSSGGEQRLEERDPGQQREQDPRVRSQGQWGQMPGEIQGGVPSTREQITVGENQQERLLEVRNIVADKT